MSSIAIQKDIGAFIVTKNAFNSTTVTAGATEDNNELTGLAIDRFVGPTSTAGSGGNLMESGQVSVFVDHRLVSQSKLTVTSNVEHASATGGTWADITDKDGSSEASKVFGSTGTTSTAQGFGELRYDLDLAKAKRYIRVMVTANHSATATAAADIDAAVVLGGHQVVPASTS